MANFNTISPIDNQVYCHRSYATDQDCIDVLQAAKQQQTAWQHTTLIERAQLCEQVIQYFEQHQVAIATEISWQMGRPSTQAIGEIAGLAERARHMIAIAEHALCSQTLSAKTGFHRYIAREPLGTVLVLAPWNYPYLTAINSIIPAIMAGNTVILKHSSQTPLCAERFDQAFQQAGFPTGVFAYLHLDHAQTTQLIQHPHIDFVAFTGSVEGGVRVQQAASQRFIPIALELGGKDPAYVREDADLELAIDNLVDGAFYNSGQSCCGIERIYVHQQHYHDFVAGYVERVKQYRLGDPLQSETTLGPVVKSSAAQFVQQQIQDAIDKGARTLIDPSLFSHHHIDTYLAPQVLIDVDHNMEIMRNETFGPAVGIMPVKDDRAALDLMNDSQFGLTASIWTQSESDAIQLGQQIQTGTVFMNRCDYLDPGLVWTGVKNSGRGHSLSTLGYQQLTRAKSFHLRLTPA